MKIKVFLILSLVASIAAGGEHYDRALELYKLGPSKAQDMLAELDLELKENPANTKALMLRAMIQQGIGQPDDALKSLAQAEEILTQKKEINAEIYYLRALCLVQKKDYEAAEKVLKPFAAFYMDSTDRKARYDKLMEHIRSKVDKTGQ